MVNTSIGVRIFTGMMMSKSTKEKSLHKLEVQRKKAQKNILKTFLEDDDFDLYLRDKKGKFCKNKMNKHEKGYLLLTQDLNNNKYSLIEAQQRQKNKGINQVINWIEFKKNFDNLCFDDEDRLMAVIEKI